jgi:hypothetical protein
MRTVWRSAMSEADKNEAHLLDFFDTKTPSKQTIIFKISDVIFDIGSHELTKEVLGKRRSLGMWLYLRMKVGPAKIPGFDISIHTATIPYRYLATRTE